MHLLVGLGNIGSEYFYTHHNFGFLLLDKIIEDYGFSMQSKKFKSEIFTGEIEKNKIIAIKPQTFMNRSGIAVLEVINFFKIPLKNIIVFHDDLDLSLGKVKVKIGGGNAGHNGLKSIDELCGINYVRLRLGIGRPLNNNFNIADYVLRKFGEKELQEVMRINQKISKLIPELISGKMEKFLNKFYAN